MTKIYLYFWEVNYLKETEQHPPINRFENAGRSSYKQVTRAVADRLIRSSVSADLASIIAVPSARPSTCDLDRTGAGPFLSPILGCEKCIPPCFIKG